MADSKSLNMSSTQAQNTIPTETRNDVYSALLSGSGIRNIEQTLDHEMSASGFKHNLKSYINHLLRSGEVTTFNEIIVRVNAKIEHDTEAAKTNASSTTNGANGVNGHAKDPDDYQLAMPRQVSVAGIRTLMAELEKVMDVVVDK